MKISMSIYLMLFVFIASAQQNTTELNNEESKFQFRAVTEVGFISVLSHKVKLGETGTYFDYVDNGGQDVLFPTVRFSLEMDWNNRNTIILLYQPLKIETQALLKEDLVANGTTFPALTGIKSLYNFPFYRISYLRDLTKNNDKFIFAIGGSLQIRNATISFESTDGTRYTDNRGVGPVPALKIRSRLNLTDRFYSELEADGMYAPISVLNGSDNETVGAILDASLRLGAYVNNSTNLFFNLRYLGGGAEGSDNDEKWPGDGYVKNWLHFFNVSAGFVLHL
ncbi:hypothetical protein OO013_16685 [Mangrovivirga sp. M17]|uniref:Outer membrane protein with beta-barrel domain n=1 Tax=Mangrovivirga halotolerans TaxID=2993936 RepID=A0ABT3RUS3_9BACT|nr:hypothetical protein [Mangrovivirga halotolerans]MCX2745519.1 hypothetical protein [Mangrovivirga halotolerans]